MKWERTIRRSTHRGSRMNNTGIAYKKTLAAVLFFMGLGTVSNFIYADVTVADKNTYGNTVTSQDLASGGKQYDIQNQQTNGSSALNKFDQFQIGKQDIANLHLGTVDRQINIVNNTINVDGVVNSLKNGNIGGDVYFFSSQGIAVGATGVFNVGRLTLGTNPAFGQDLYNGNLGNLSAEEFAKKGSVEKAQFMNTYYSTIGSEWGNGPGEGTINIKGKIYAGDGEVVIAAPEKITLDGAEIHGGVTFNAVGKNWTADNYRNNFVNLDNVEDASMAVKTDQGIALVTNDTMSLNQAKLYSYGRDIDLIMNSPSADLQADKNKPENGVISITESYIDSSSQNRDSGDISVQAIRDRMGVSKVEVKGTTIHAGGQDSRQAGDVTILATAQTQLYAWDIGDGAYAVVDMGQSEDGKRNEVTGDNISISAKASTTGDIGKETDLTEEEAAAAIQKESDENAVLGLLKDIGGNLRGQVSATKIYADAEVKIDNTDMVAVGGTKGEAGKEHGNISLTSHAESAIQPITVGLLNFGVNVGISDVTSKVNVDNSGIYADNVVKTRADAENKVALTMVELAKVPVPLTVNMSWAELSNTVEANIGSGTTITSGGDVTVEAESRRQLTSNVSNGSDDNMVGIAAAVGISNTSATAKLDGTVYTGGKVKVDALNAPTMTSEGSGVYNADSVKAITTSGKSYIHAITESKPVSTIITGIKEAFLGQGDGSPGKFDQFTQKFGVSGATALLFGDNDATASVGGTIRGVDAAKDSGTGRWKGNDDIGAKALDVSAKTITRTSVRSGAYQDEWTGKDEAGNPVDKKKNVGIALNVNYASQDDTAEAYIIGDVKTKGDVVITAETERPWQTKWQDGTPASILQNTIFALIDNNPVLPDLVDSWSQSSSNGESASGAGSIGVMDYKNTAKAYIGENAAVTITGDSEDSAVEGDLMVSALNTVKSVNFSGDIRSPLSELPVTPNFWKDLGTNLQNPLGNQTANAIGGAALSVLQTNTAEAYIAGGAKKITAKGNVDVKAENNAWNLAMAAAGGKADSLALNGTVNVNRLENETTAYIGNRDVESKDGDININAVDDSTNINIGGVVSASGGGSSVGATIAYNHIDRVTKAYSQGRLTAGGLVEANAQNTGDIYAIAAAGSVAYDGKMEGGPDEGKDPTDNAGDAKEIVSGLLNMNREDEIDPWLFEDEVESAAGSINDASKAIEGVSDSTPDLNEEVKNSFAGAANIGINRVVDKAQAYIAKTENGTASVTADALHVASLNDSKIYNTSGAMALNLSAEGNNKALAGSFMWNSITAENDAYIDGATLTLTGDEKEGTDQSLLVEAANKEDILNIAMSGSGARSGSAGAGQVSVNWIDNTNNAYVRNSTINADEAVTIHADNGETINSYTGAVAIAGGGNGSAVGASIAVNLVDGESNAYMENSSMGETKENTRGGDLSVTAEDTSKLTSIVASGAGTTGKFAGAFSASGNDVDITTKAYVDTAKAINAGNIGINAANHSIATIGVGTAAVGQSAAGGSVAVMLNDSTVEAYLKGDSNKQSTVNAENITIKAENLYNGSADKENDEDSTAKTVAVGGAVGTGKFAFAGSVTVNKVNQTTDAYLGAGKYNVNDGKVNIDAYTVSNLFGMAGGLSLSKGSGIGAAVDTQVYDGHTYASIEYGANVTGASEVSVDAESKEDMTSVAATLAATLSTGDSVSFAGAGAAGAHKISTDTKAYIGNKEDKTVSKENAAELSNVGSVTVNAKDTTELTTASGAGGVAISAKGAGVGLSAAVEVVNKNVGAFVGNNTSISADGLSVTAENTSHSTTAAAGLGAGGTAGIAGSASETIVNHTTKAYVGKGAETELTGDALVKAVGSFTQSSGAGAVGGGNNAGIGLANATVKLTADTRAYADDHAKLSGKSVSIDADNTVTIKYGTVAGGVANTGIALNGAVGVNALDTTTHAYVGQNAEISAEEASGISVTADDTTNLHGGTGGFAIAVQGGAAGAAVTVNNVKKDTEAYVKGGAKLSSKGKTEIKATSTEDIYNLSLQGSGGYAAGVAGAVTVMNLGITTKAYTDSKVEINQKDGYKEGGDITIDATHDLKLDSTVVGAAVGAVAVGAAVDVANVTTQTNAYIGDGNRVNAKGELTVSAKDKLGSEDKDITSSVVAGSIGGGSVSGSISVYSFGSGMTEEDKENLTSDFDSWLNAQMNESGTSTALGAYGGTTEEIKDALDKVEFNNETPTTKGEKGTMAKIGTDSQITTGDVEVTANDQLFMENKVGNGAAGSVAAAGASVATVNSHTSVKAQIDDKATISAVEKAVKVTAGADHHLDAGVYGASVGGGLAVQGTVATWRDNSQVLANVGSGVNLTGGSLTVSAENNRTMDANAVGASVALGGALVGAVIDADVGGSAKAIIGSEEEKVDEGSGPIVLSGEFSVTSDAKTDLSAEAIAPAVGMVAGAGAGTYLTSGVDTATSVKSGSIIKARKINISAAMTPKLNAYSTGVGAGIAGVGATVAKVESKDKASVTVGDNVSLNADEKVTIKAETARPEEGDNLYAKAIAGSGGVIAGAVSTTDVILNQDTSVTIGKNNKIEADTLDILAKHEDATNFRNESVAAGGVSGTGAETKTDIDSTVTVSIGAGTQIDTKNETAVKALNRTLKGNYDGSNSTKTVYSGGASLANGNGIVNDTDIDHITKVDIGDSVKIQAAASALTEEEKTAGKTLADKNAIAIDAQSDITAKDYYVIGTGAAIGAAHIKNTMDASADTDVAVGTGAEFLAGDTEVASKSYTDNPSATETKFGQDVGGGSIAVAAKNTAELESKTLVDIFGAAGYAGGSNDVTYDSHADTVIGGSTKLETANGDIRLAAGRDSDGNIGTVSVKAISNILNATAIPVSVVKDPHAKATHDVKITVNKGAELLSDRNIYLQSRAMEEDVQVSGSGEIKDWTRKVGEIFGASSSIGKTTRDYTAQVEFNGKAETGIHRNQSITIGGTNENGTWKTEIERTGGISYDFITNVEVGKALLERLDELRDLKAKYSSDAAAVAAYDAEISFLEEKLVANGLGVFETDDNGNRTFVEFDLETKSDLEIANNEIGNLNQGATDKDGKPIVDENGKQLTVYEVNMKLLEDSKAESEKRVEAMDNLSLLNTKWQTAEQTSEGAAADLTKKNDAYTIAQGKYEDAVIAFNEAAEKLDGVTEDAPEYKELKNAYDMANSQKESAELEKTQAKTAWQDAETEANKAKTAAEQAKVDLTTAVGEYDKTYGTNYLGAAGDSGAEAQFAAERTDYANLSKTIDKAYESAEKSYTTLQESIAASDHFHNVANGGEGADGTFSYTGDAGTLTQDKDTGIYTWTYTDSEGKERSGVVLHKNSYGLTTSEIRLGDIEARLGDIVGEGQEIYGSGSLVAHGDAKVTITNNSPNNIITGDIQIKGGSSVVTSEDGETAINKVGGGTITWNGQAMHSADDLTNQNDSQKDKNAGKGHTFGGSVITKKNAIGENAPSVTIESTFNPTNDENLHGDKIAYVAPTIQVGTAGGENLVYNPGGSVTVKSAYGDIYNNATVNAGGVSIEATNGDFVQSYVNRITSVSGNPNDDSKETGVGTGSGILANGNIFISARYVNINGTIQSGIAEWNVEIPAEPKLYYKDGDKTVTVSIEDVAKDAAKYNDKTLYVEGAKGNGADYVTYDPDSKRFLLSGIEVNGGTVDIVGTIMNTAKEGAEVGKILALDGYGSITVKNHSNIDLELGNLSTGSGVEGKITITDLDLKTGKKTNTVTYTRENGKITQLVETFDKDGNSTGSSNQMYGENDKVTYKPSDGIYYVWQTGQDSTTVTSYHHRSKEFNIFGKWGDIGDLIKNSEVTDVKTTDKYDIDPDGTFVGDAAAAHRGDDNVNDYYQSSEETYTTSTSEAYDKKTKTKRLWYSLGTVKQYDTYFKVKTGTTTITTNSIKANQEIGIGFVGNEAGGTLSVNGGTANVYVGGVITNQGGSAGGLTAITAGSIQQGDYGFIHTDALTLTATEGSVGGERTDETTGKISVNNAIQTDAAKLSGSAKGSFSVIVTDHGVNLGDISAGNTVSISAGGDIIQNADAKDLSANRVVLNTGNGKIAGESDSAFRIAVGQPGENANEENYGLKANASGDISFKNTRGDLYVDSVISSAGDVTISTNGSFIDNNFTDVDDATAQEKLLAWAEAAVLEGADQTETKQKEMLKAQVDSDYAQWKILSDQVNENGQFVLTEEMRSQLKESGVDEAGIAAYVDARQAAYDKLKAQGVDGWTDDDVSDFKDEIDSAEGIYGRANLTKTELADKFSFLNADDVANTLVGSAKSAEQLLIGFAPGGIKDGITDTNITIKGTPHVSGKNVTLNTTADGNIGNKVTAADIDLSKEGWYNSLSKADLLALSTAEQGDFQYGDNKITVSTVKGIDVEAAGVVNAVTQNGSIYLVSEGAMNLGTIDANGGELRIKASGDLIGGDAAISAGGNIVLESGSGGISDIVLDKEGTGILTARAKDGVSISKAGDLVINTVYAAEGDVTLNVSDGEDTHDILASDGTDDANKGNDKNIKGQNITLEGVNHLGTVNEGTTKSLGIEVDGGRFTAHIKGDGDITVYGDMGDADFSTEKNLRLHNEGLISGGKYKVEGTLTLWNKGTESESIGEEGSMSGITGGEFEANHVQLENHATITSGHFTANESYTVNNHESGSFVKTEKDGETTQATVESKTVTVNNWGIVSGGIFHATGERSDDGKGNVTYTAYEGATTEGGTLISDNADVTIIANGGDVTFDKIHAENGSANISEVGNLSITDVQVGGRYAVETSGNAEFETVKAGAVTITAGGSISGTTLTTEASEALGADGSAAVTASGGSVTIGTSHIGENYAVSAKMDAELTDITSGGSTTITAGRNVVNSTIDAGGGVTAEAGGVLTSGSIKAEGQDVSISTAGKTEIGSLTAGTTNIETTGEGSNVAINKAIVSGTHTVNAKGNATFDAVHAGAVGIIAGGSVSGTTLTTTAGNAGLEAGENISIGTISSAESITGTAGGTLTSDSIKANENVTLNSAGDMSIKYLETEKGTAELTSEAGKVDLMTSKIQGALSVNAGKDITVTTSDSVSLNMNAGGSILATGEGATISSGDITLTAGEDITISDRDGGAWKLEGVDMDGTPDKVTGTGTAAPLVNGESAGDLFDTSTTGSAVISSSTGKITMEVGETVSADHVVLGKEGTVLDEGGTLNINANVVGIDSLESHGTDKVTVTVKGNYKPAYHVGIHSGTDASVTVKNSYIQHLDLTGKDNIGIENTAISGNSRLETDKIFVDIRDNPGNSQAQGFGHITLSGYDISSGGHFTDIHDGITINGATRPVTAMSVMNRSLYGLGYAGKDAEEKAREESTDANVEILFAEVMSYEKYHSIRM